MTWKMDPGMHISVPMHDYVNDQLCEVPTLSSSMANVIIDQSPMHARFLHPRLSSPQVRPFSRVANFGSAVAAMVFDDCDVVFVDADNYQTKAAREARDAALAQGNIPLLQDETTRAFDVAETAKLALKSLVGGYIGEATIIFRQGEAVCRSRPDVMSTNKTLLVDLKVTGTNARDANRQFFSMGYDMQAAFMERAADSLDPENIGRREIVYLFVEAEPPHGYSFIQVSESTLQVARKKMNAAVNLWSRCLKEDQWPGYQSSRTLTSRPSYEETAWLLREETDRTINVEYPK